MVDRSCGKNMVFKELARFNITCVDKCVCANKFVEYNMRCVQYISNELDDKHAGGYHSKVSSSSCLTKFTTFLEKKTSE